ncbi:MAG: phosphoheptose isomerase [Deltaproteobacteria bacterium CG11_big_fil_rev_8_21_14_0_20_47_16]|nr:MAG: phosphoheptose isomerase [Deltaproteobacteria bacterium CG11_big_fil_rev_8_21_14_0_20_47_16]
MDKFYQLYLHDTAQLLEAVSATTKNFDNLELSEAFQSTFLLFNECRQRGNKIFYIGNGGSSTIASHIATDAWKCAGLKAQTFNDAAGLTCIGNDDGFEHVFAAPLRILGNPGDILVAISSSGASPDILKAVEVAQEKKIAVITYSGFDEKNPLRLMGVINFYVPSRRYGHVEIAHLALCHAILDRFALEQ